MRRFLTGLLPLTLLLAVAMGLHAQDAAIPLLPDTMLAPIDAGNAADLTTIYSEELRGGVYGLQFSADGNTMLATSMTVLHRIIDLTTGSSIDLDITWGSGSSFYPTLSPDGTRVAINEIYWVDSSLTARISLWDATTGEYLTALAESAGPFNGVRWQPDNTLLVHICPEANDQGSCNGSYRRLLFDGDGTELEREEMDFMPGIDLGFEEVFVRDRQTDTRYGTMVMYDEYPGPGPVVLTIGEGQDMQTVETGFSALTNRASVALSEDGTRLLLAIAGGTLVLYDTATMEAIWTVEDAYEHDITGLAVSPGGEVVATVGGIYSYVDEENASQKDYVREDAYLRLWDGTSGELLHEIDVHKDEAAEYDSIPVQTVAFTPDGLYLVYGGMEFVFMAVLDGPTCQITAASTVNARAQPSTQAARAGTLSGSATAIGQREGDDGFVWWYLMDGRWVRSDVVQAEETCADLPVVE